MRRAARLLACLAGVACAGLGAHAQLATRDEPLDLRITGGRIVDGTGNPWFHGDVGVRDGRIVAVGRVDAPAVRVVDASGLVVAPGFVDIHNHSDDSIVADPNAESMVRQGVTTMVFGEGGSAAPSERWPRLADYFETLETQGISLNVGTYVGSSQVWTAVHGDREGPPSADAMTRMRAIVAQAMRDGALGVSSSLSGPPGVWIDTDTLVAMCEEAARFGGRYSTHMRTEGLGVFEAVDEALEIGRRAGVPVDIIHLKIAEHTMWGRMPELLSRIADARARGQQVEAHVYPYRAGQNNLVSIVPPWAHEGGTAAMLDRLRDPALRPRLRDEILGRREIPGWYNHYTATGSWEGMLLVSLSNPADREFEGRRMQHVIDARGGDPVDVLFELLIANGGSVPTVYFHHSEQDMRTALAQPFVSVGSDGRAVATEGPLSGGHPHPRYYGTFPRVLGRYVREEGVLTLEEAVRKMTSANTAKIGVYDRGLLRPGQWADVTIFDAARVVDRATFESPHQYAEGVVHVIVNGQVVLDAGGRHTGVRAGRVIRGQGWTGQTGSGGKMAQGDDRP